MRLQTSLECLTALPEPKDLSQLQKDIAPEWIEEALCTNPRRSREVVPDWRGDIEIATLAYTE